MTFPDFTRHFFSSLTESVATFSRCHSDYIMALFDQISEDIKSAMKACDNIWRRSATLRKCSLRQRLLLEPTTHWLMLMY